MRFRGDDGVIPLSLEHTEPDIIGSRKAPTSPRPERVRATRSTGIGLLFAMSAVVIGWQVTSRGAADVGTSVPAGLRQPPQSIANSPAVINGPVQCAQASGTGSQLPPPVAAAYCLPWGRAGDYSSSVLGLTYRRPFNFTLPDGWTVTRGLGEVDVRSGNAGLTLFVYPAPTPQPEVSDTPMWRWLHAQKWLVVSDERSATLGGVPGRQLDIRPLDNARVQKSGCQLQTPCIRLLTGTVAGVRSFAATATIELHPGITSRLWFGATLSAPPAVLIWNANDADEYQHPSDTQTLLHSLQLGDGNGNEQGQPAPLR